MSEALVPMNDARRVVENMPAQGAATLEDFAQSLGLSVGDVAGVLSHKDVAQALVNITKARAALATAPAVNRLIQILNSDDDKTALTAASLILKLSGLQKAPQVKVTLSFDELLKQGAQAQPGPLAGITAITEAEAIDVEEYAENEYGDSYPDE